jgi:hypothetical protein
MAAVVRSGNAESKGSRTGGTATKAIELNARSMAEGCINGACIVGIVLQQSCPLCPCGEQGIEPQHCIACSGVVIASQSKTYTPSNKAITLTRIDRAIVIYTKLIALIPLVKFCRCPAGRPIRHYAETALLRVPGKGG